MNTSQTRTGGVFHKDLANSRIATSDEHVEALMGGHSMNVPDTRRKDVTQPRLHDAYIGNNELLANTMIDLLINGDISFVTSVLMPLFHHPNTTIKWKEINEDNGLMEPEQEGGVPSLKSTSMSEYSAFMQRFGRAAIFSHGFANTEQGRSLFRVRLAHMAKEIQRTLDIRGLYAIIASKNHYISVFSNLSEYYNCGGAISTIDCFEREIATFALLQKEERGLFNLDERLRTKLELNGANPDSWVMLTEMQSHCAMESAEVEYNRAGSIGRVHLNQGKNSMMTFRGCNVYAVKDYDVYGRSINAFKRTRVIGDFWAIRDFGFQKPYATGIDYQKRLQTDVYCCGTDRFENFSLLEAMSKTNVIIGMDIDGKFEYSEWMKQWKNEINKELEKEGGDEDELNKRLHWFTHLLMLETPLIYINYDARACKLFYETGNDDTCEQWLDMLQEVHRYVKFTPSYTAPVIHMDSVTAQATTIDPSPTQSPAIVLSIDGVSKVSNVAKELKKAKPSSDLFTITKSLLEPSAPVFTQNLNAQDNDVTSVTENMKSLLELGNYKDGKANAKFLAALKHGFDQSTEEDADVQRSALLQVYKDLSNSATVSQVMASAAIGYAMTNENTQDVHKSLESLANHAFYDNDTGKRDDEAIIDLTCESHELYRKCNVLYSRAIVVEEAMNSINIALGKVVNDYNKNDDKSEDETMRVIENVQRCSVVLQNYASIDNEADVTKLSTLMNEAIFNSTNQGVNTELIHHTLANIAHLHQQTTASGNVDKSAVQSIVYATYAAFNVIKDEHSEIEAGLRQGKNVAELNLKGTDDISQLMQVAVSTAAHDPDGKPVVPLWRPEMPGGVVGSNMFKGEDEGDDVDFVNNILSLCNSYKFSKDQYSSDVIYKTVSIGLTHTTDNIKQNIVAVITEGSSIQKIQDVLALRLALVVYNDVVRKQTTHCVQDLSEKTFTSEFKNLLEQNFTKKSTDGSETPPLGWRLQQRVERRVRTIATKIANKPVEQRSEKNRIPLSDGYGKPAYTFVYKTFQIFTGAAKASAEFKIHSTTDAPMQHFCDLWNKFASQHAEQNLPFPLSVMCYRPFRRYQMGSAVLMESGRNTGITAYAHNDMQVGNDPQSKQTLVHFTGNFASVVLDSSRIAVAPDIFCCDYQGGEDCNFVDAKDFQEKHGHLNPMAYVQKSGAGTDIFAVPGPCLAAANISSLEFTKCSRPVDITGSFRQCCSKEECITPGIEAMNRLYKFSHSADRYMPAIEDYIDQEKIFHAETNMNTTCFQATQKIVSKDGANTNFIRGRDHFGSFIGPGARNARKGLVSGKFEEFKFEKKKLVEVDR